MAQYNPVFTSMKVNNYYFIMAKNWNNNNNDIGCAILKAYMYEYMDMSFVFIKCFH